MDHPVREIGGVITALCQGTQADQQAALQDYFTPDAFFIHPFCWVPPFANLALPLTTTTLNSRLLLSYIYSWYRILSPTITLTIDSAVLDQHANLLYLTIRQAFSLWFVPFGLWTAHVKLVTVLHLEKLPVDSHTGKPLLRAADAEAVVTAPGDATVVSRYFIRGQEDLYQVGEFLKFVAPHVGNYLWGLWQLFSTLLCVVGVVVFWPVTFVREYVAANAPELKRRVEKMQ